MTVHPEMSAGERRAGWSITGLALLWILALALLTGCPWLDEAAIETSPALKATIAQAIAEAEAKGLTPAQTEALVEAKVEAARPALAAEATEKALAAAGKAASGDLLGGGVGLAEAVIAAYVAYRGAKPLAQAGIRRYRRRKVAGTPVTT